MPYNPSWERDAAKEKVEEKTGYEDHRDEWLTCPECGSENAKIISWSYDAVAACGDCGYNTEIYGE